MIYILLLIPKGSTKKFINPTKKGIITSSFGERKSPLSNKKEFHNGIDIALEEGSDVLAVYSGKITEVGESRSYGNYIKYDVGDNIVIMYAHLKSVDAEEGDTVKKGQVIAKVGSTGYSTGPHLHYAIYKDEKETDPMIYTDYDVTSDVIEEYTARGDSIEKD